MKLLKLLIGSVYLDHARSGDWYKLQMKYLNRTTENFEHVVYLNGRDNHYNQSTVLKVDTSPAKTCQDGHIRGLNAIIDMFNSSKEYENLLLLDSDCFPIQHHWEPNLLKTMGNFDVAAAARYENLDTFAHPCVFYVKKQAAKGLRFGMFTQKNIVGLPFEDTSSNITSFFPLIRSNRLNYHPVLCGIYWNAFYHHGAGFRNLGFRLFYSYFNKNRNVASMETKLFNELVGDSDRFLQDLSLTRFQRKMY